LTSAAAPLKESCAKSPIGSNCFSKKSTFILPPRSFRQLVRRGLTPLCRFIFGKAPIEERANRTARRLSQNPFQLAFLQPNPFAAFAAIQNQSHKAAPLELSRTLWTVHYLPFPPGRFHLLKLGLHTLHQFVFFRRKIVIFIGSLVKLYSFAEEILFDLHDFISPFRRAFVAERTIRRLYLWLRMLDVPLVVFTSLCVRRLLFVLEAVDASHF